MHKFVCWCDGVSRVVEMLHISLFLLQVRPLSMKISLVLHHDKAPPPKKFVLSPFPTDLKNENLGSWFWVFLSDQNLSFL